MGGQCRGLRESRKHPGGDGVGKKSLTGERGRDAPSAEQTQKYWPGIGVGRPKGKIGQRLENSVKFDQPQIQLVRVHFESHVGAL